MMGYELNHVSEKGPRIVGDFAHYFGQCDMAIAQW